jgi:hypothetical protein
LQTLGRCFLLTSLTSLENALFFGAAAAAGLQV